jgi:hypothetical protein
VWAWAQRVSWKKSRESLSSTSESDREGNNVGVRGRGRRGRSGNNRGGDDEVLRRVTKMRIEVDTGFRERDDKEGEEGRTSTIAVDLGRWQEKDMARLRYDLQRSYHQHEGYSLFPGTERGSQGLSGEGKPSSKKPFRFPALHPFKPSYLYSNGT